MSKYSTVNPIWPCTVQNCNRHQKKICPCLPLIGCYSVLRPLTLDATMLRRQKTYRVQCTWFLTWFLEGWRRANSAGLPVWTEACCSESSGEGSQTEHLHSPRITSPVKTKCPGGCDKGWKSHTGQLMVSSYLKQKCLSSHLDCVPYLISKENWSYVQKVPHSQSYFCFLPIILLWLQQQEKRWQAPTGEQSVHSHAVSAAETFSA